MWDANTTIKGLEQLVANGGDLPSVVIVKGVLGACGSCVETIAQAVPDLAPLVGKIDQPQNELLQLSYLAKKADSGMGYLTKMYERRTGIGSDVVEEVPDDYSHREAQHPSLDSIVIAELLVTRLFGTTHKVYKTDQDGKIVEPPEVESIRRGQRNARYNVFHHRSVSEGLHVIGSEGREADLVLPPVIQGKMAEMQEPPSLFLSVADAFTEWGRYFNKKGPEKETQHLNVQVFPEGSPQVVAIGDPYTHLSLWIFMDQMSAQDDGDWVLGSDTLGAIDKAAKTVADKRFLWEPRGYYNYDWWDAPIPDWCSFRESEFVTGTELASRAQVAAKENSANTDHCEPTFSREELPSLRSKECCYRYAELAIPKGEPVTILARPVKSGGGRTIALVPPHDAENGEDKDLAEASRYRFRILKGHTFNNLLKQRTLGINVYYALGIVGCACLVAGGGTGISMAF